MPKRVSFPLRLKALKVIWLQWSPQKAMRYFHNFNASVLSAYFRHKLKAYECAKDAQF
uniref:Uncharacterized protein n=1 Tax=Parascaris equorum TaxID=6256 RepID=A0A914RC59_PAREQ